MIAPNPICYHIAMATSLRDQDARFRAARADGDRYCIYPEEYGWIVALPHQCCAPDAQECPHWPQFSVVPGNPRHSSRPRPEIYMGFRSDPRALLGVLRLNDDPDPTLTVTPDLIRGRAFPTSQTGEHHG